MCNGRHCHTETAFRTVQTTNADMKQRTKDTNKERSVTGSEHRSLLVNQRETALKLLELHEKEMKPRAEEAAKRSDMEAERMEKLLMLVVWGPS
jgi:hypothetical protein